MTYQTGYSAVRGNPAGVALVVGMHAVFVVALLTGLRVHPGAPPPPPMTGEVLPDKLVNPADPPVPANPTLRFFKPDPKLRPLDLPDQPPMDGVREDPGAIDPGLAGSSEPLRQPVLTRPAVDQHFPLTQPPYPPSAVRSGAEGSLALEILVGVDGRVRIARVLRSSGFQILDQAALDEARRHWKLLPATRDGAPFEQWFTLKVVFHLENR